MAEREYRQISDLPTGITPITGAEIVELEQDGVSRKFSMVALSGVVAEHEDKHQFGGEDPVGTHDLVANAIPYLDADGTIDSRVSDASTTVKGKVLLAEDGGTTPGTVVQATDSRLGDARDPTEHASTHQPDSTDPIPLATTSVPGLMGNGDKTKLDGINTSLIPTAAQSAALAGTYGTPGGDNRFVTDTDPRIGGEGPDITDLVNWAAFTDVELVSNGFTANTSFTGRYLATIKESGTEKLVICDPAGTRQVVSIPLEENFGTTAMPGLGAWESAKRIGDRTYFLLGTGSTHVKYWDGSDDTEYNTNIGQTIPYPTAMSYFNNYLFIGGTQGQVVRSDLDGNETTLTSGISEQIVDFVEHEGSFYAVTRSTVDSLGDFYLYDEANDTFTALNLTRRRFSCACSYNGKLLASTITTTDPILVFVDTDFVETETQEKYRACLFPYDDKLYSIERSLTYGYPALFLYDTFTTPSINMTAPEGSVYLPSSLPIGSRKVIRKLGSDATKYITITPPAGCTIEGRSELKLYGQYSYVELERVSATVFAIKDLKDTAVINIRDYGAIGDGVTDNTEVLTTALATPGVREIYIPDGVYIVSDTLTVPSTIKKIYGVGTIKSNISTTATAMIVLNGATTVSDIKLEGNSIDTAIFTISPVKIENVEISGFSEGINYQQSASFNGAIFSKCYIHDNVTGLYIVNRAEYCKILDCSINGNTNVGVFLTAGNAIIDGNNVNGNGSGIVLAEGSNDSHAIIVGNNVNHNTAYGIRLLSLTEFMCNVSENHLFNYGCTGASLSVENILAGRSCIINNNFISGGATLDADNLNAPIHFISNVMADLPVTQSNDTVVYYGRESIDKHTRIKYLTGTTAANQGETVGIAHGVDASKITAVHILVYCSSNNAWIPPEFDLDSAYKYSYLVSNVNVLVYNIGAKSSQILSAPIKISIEYEV